MQIDFSRLSPSARYFLMTQTIIPRPVAWVLTRNDDDDNGGAPSFNLAPFSYFCAVCSDPALLMISIGEKPAGGDKNTARNIRARGRFVVHIAPQKLARALNETSASLPYGESEIDKVGLSLTAFAGRRRPRRRRMSAALARMPTRVRLPLTADFGDRRERNANAFFRRDRARFRGRQRDAHRRQITASSSSDHNRPAGAAGRGGLRRVGGIIDLPRPL